MSLLFLFNFPSRIKRNRNRNRKRRYVGCRFDDRRSALPFENRRFDVSRVGVGPVVLLPKLLLLRCRRHRRQVARLRAESTAAAASTCRASDGACSRTVRRRAQSRRRQTAGPLRNRRLRSRSAVDGSAIVAPPICRLFCSRSSGPIARLRPPFWPICATTCIRRWPPTPATAPPFSRTSIRFRIRIPTTFCSRCWRATKIYKVRCLLLDFLANNFQCHYTYDPASFITLPTSNEYEYVTHIRSGTRQIRLPHFLSPNHYPPPNFFLSTNEVR